MPKCLPEQVVPINSPLYRGENRLLIALTGLANSGKTTIFENVASTFVRAGELTGTHRPYQECSVQVGLDEISLVDLPDIDCLQHLRRDDLAALKYLLWGNERPPVSIHETQEPPAPFAPPDLIIQVVDASSLERHLELTLELAQLGRPMVIALNRMDEARRKNLTINIESLSQLVGVPVIPTTAITGHGIWELFTTAIDTVRTQVCPLPLAPSEYLAKALTPLNHALNKRDIHTAFRVPHAFLLQQVAAEDHYFISEIQHHFPDRLTELLQLRDVADEQTPRSLAEEIHADRHHQAATLFEKVTRIGGPYEKRSWRYFLDELFLDPRWGLFGSLAIFAVILFMVFEVSAWLDTLTIAPLIEYTEQWQPSSISGIVGRGVVDGIIGMMGIVIPYMLPLVILLVSLEQCGIMQRIAFVMDRGFHHIGLRGGTAASFLLGLGCNVPAIASVAAASKGRERVIASLLITFVPCSARSAIILAIAGKYLGGVGVFIIFIATIVVIALLGRLLNGGKTKTRPGVVQAIPAFALPRPKTVLRESWSRSQDVITTVTPLLIAGSIVLALLAYFGADQIINTVFIPITDWCLGLPVVLGVPILFGILRKELSLLMIYQALGTFEIDLHMNWIQISTFLLFLTFYIPCLSTVAIMLRTVGRKYAAYSIALSAIVALFISTIARGLMHTSQFFGV